MNTPDLIRALQRAEVLALAAASVAEFGSHLDGEPDGEAIAGLLDSIEQACAEARAALLPAQEA